MKLGNSSLGREKIKKIVGNLLMIIADVEDMVTIPNLTRNSLLAEWFRFSRGLFISGHTTSYIELGYEYHPQELDIYELDYGKPVSDTLTIKRYVKNNDLDQRKSLKSIFKRRSLKTEDEDSNPTSFAGLLKSTQFKNGESGYVTSYM